jgi:hypothetical protein
MQCRLRAAAHAALPVASILNDRARGSERQPDIIEPIAFPDAGFQG